MKFETNIFFYLFLRRFQPDLVCDIGSCDGHNSLMCRKFAPQSRVVAFEANPDNYSEMCANKNLERNRIEVVHKAVTDRTGSLTFHVLEAREGAEHAWRKGSSSLHQRQDGLATKPVEVPAIRLDEFVANLQPSPSGIALWVDVEGAAYETLDGMQAVADRVHIVSAEVETKECWPGQKLASDVHALLKGLGFRYVGRGLGYREVQYDVLYVNERMYSRHPFGIRWLLLQTILLTGIKHTCGSLYAVLKRCCGDR